MKVPKGAMGGLSALAANHEEGKLCTRFLACALPWMCYTPRIRAKVAIPQQESIEMTTQTTEQLRSGRCVACEGGVQKLSPTEAREQLGTLSGWQLVNDGQRIQRDWKVRNFRAGMEFLNQVAEVAEREGHHPDLHLERFRHVSITIWTHAIGGLSENDFILAAKIDQLSAKA
jgi:4a-hydroxytetrahydrobiopterin dehydratase